jgi:hypothetical protein
MNVDLRIKWDPQADGRVASPGDMVEAWVQWQCPLAADFRIKIGRLGNPALGEPETVYQTTTRTDWAQVMAYFQARGVILPDQPSCPGF